MDLKSISFFSSLNQKMSWLTERQKVLAQNIANANTPGYTPKDLKKVSFKAHLDQTKSSGGLQMQTSDNRHLSSTTGSNGGFEVEKSNFAIGTPDGNAVNLEEELVKMAETQMEFTMATNLYRKHVGMVKTALGKK